MLKARPRHSFVKWLCMAAQTKLPCPCCQQFVSSCSSYFYTSVIRTQGEQLMGRSSCGAGVVHLDAILGQERCAAQPAQPRADHHDLRRVRARVRRSRLRAAGASAPLWRRHGRRSRRPGRPGAASPAAAPALHTPHTAFLAVQAPLALPEVEIFCSEASFATDILRWGCCCTRSSLSCLILT